jgi:hypothetical protein
MQRCCRIRATRRGLFLFVPRGITEPLLGAAFVVAIVWINFWICGQTFWIEYTGKMNSMHGVWIAMARQATVHWYRPYWWPHWYLGTPFEYTYAPLVPGLTAAIARLGHISNAHGFQIVSGLVYCFGPLALYLMARQLTGRRVWSFIAAVVYSLTAGSELLLPDVDYSVRHWGDARRLYLCFVWDELPHQLGLAMVLIAVLFLARALERRKFGTFVWAGVFVALSLLASAFGATALAFCAVCLLATCKTATWKQNVLLVGLCGFLGWLAMCPYLPPSLIRIIRVNSQLFPNTAFTATSGWVAAAVGAGAVLLWFLSRRWQPWYLRFFLLLTFLMFATAGLEEKWHVHFVPQAGRYKVELEAMLVLLVVFAAATLIDRLPRTVQLVLAVALVWTVYQQMLAHRDFSRNVIQPADMAQTIEYQVAHWVEPNLPGWRVLAPGSIAQWMNTFTRVPQFTGGSFPTAPNAVQLGAWWNLVFAGDVKLAPLWFKAYGVDAVIMAGADSPEFWKPHPFGHLYDSVFPILWDQRDTRIYEVPRVHTPAHVIPAAALVTRAPDPAIDRAEMERYVRAMDTVGASATAFRWWRDGRALLHADVKAGDVVSVQVNYHPGWRAKAGGIPIPVEKDGLGLIVLKPQRPGSYDIELLYGADWEFRLCRVLSVATLLGVAGFALLSRRRRASKPGAGPSGSTTSLGLPQGIV